MRKVIGSIGEFTLVETGTYRDGSPCLRVDSEDGPYAKALLGQNLE